MPYQPIWNSPYVPQVGQYAPQASQMTQQQMAYQQTGTKKVNGPQSALMYPVLPNTQSEPLFDYNGKVFYIVSADSAGSKTLETFDYFPHVDEKPAQFKLDDFVTRQEFDALSKRVNDALGVTHGVHGPVRHTGDAWYGTEGENVHDEADAPRGPNATDKAGRGVGRNMPDA